MYLWYVWIVYDDFTFWWSYVILVLLVNMLLVYVDVHDYEHARYKDIWSADIAYDPLLGLLDSVGLWGFT